jgi:hypothetical protein
MKQNTNPGNKAQSRSFKRFSSVKYFSIINAVSCRLWVTASSLVFQEHIGKFLDYCHVSFENMHLRTVFRILTYQDVWLFLRAFYNSMTNLLTIYIYKVGATPFAHATPSARIFKSYFNLLKTNFSHFLFLNVYFACFWWIFIFKKSEILHSYVVL